jgi:hypothetical protein
MRKSWWTVPELVTVAVIGTVPPEANPGAASPLRETESTTSPGP